MFWQLVANGLVTGSVIAIAAVGVSIVYGILRLINFAYGDFMAFGALAAYAFNGPLGIPLVPAVLIAMILTAAEFGTYVAAESEKWSKVVKFAGIKPE